MGSTRTIVSRTPNSKPQTPKGIHHRGAENAKVRILVGFEFGVGLANGSRRMANEHEHDYKATQVIYLLTLCPLRLCGEILFVSSAKI
jgi:hypothetical protein